MTEVTDAEKAAELEDRLGRDYPESVILNEDNPQIIGRFVRVDSGPSDYGPVPIFVIADRDGKEYGLWGFHAVLRSQFAAKKPKPGELVGVRFLGERENSRPGGKPYKNYRVEAWSQDVANEIDWSLIDAAGQHDGWAEPIDEAPAKDAALPPIQEEPAYRRAEEVTADPTTSNWGNWS